MKITLTLCLLIIAATGYAQPGKVNSLPEVVYVRPAPDKYIWERVCQVKGRTMLHNTITASDSMVYSFGGFNGNEPYKYNCIYGAQRELGRLEGGRFTREPFGYPGPGLTTNIFFIRDSLMYIGGGRDSCRTRYAWQDFWQYNMNTHVWKRLNDLPFYYVWTPTIFPEKSRVVVLIAQLTFVDTNFAHSRPVFYSYDPSNDQWTVLSGSLPDSEIRQQLACNPPGIHLRPVAFRIEDNIFVLLQTIGARRTDCSNAFYKFGIKDKEWTKLPYFPGWLETSAFAVSDGTYGFIGGGFAYSRAYRKEVYRYDPVREKWEQITNLPRGIAYGSGWRFRGETYVGFGLNDKDNTVAVWKLKQKK